jgi:MraZ protein
MLIGEYSSKIGNKNRVAVPKKFRDLMNEDLIVTRGYEQSLILVDKERWKALLKSLEVRSLLNTDVRDVKRYLVGGAYEIELDNQGRFVLNDTLREFGNINEEVVFVGIENWIEIWDKDRWQDKINNLSNNIADLGDRLAEIE